MAKQVLNLRSSVEGKQPTQDQLEYGQIAINYFKDKEKIFLKNTNNEVVDIIPSHEVDTRIATATNDMLTKTVADGTYQAQGDYVETNTYNADKATFALKTEMPSVNLSNGYTESSLSNEELEPKPNESFETAIGKLHKAIKDNEVIESTAFDTIKNSCGFDTNGKYKPTNELISGTTSLSDAMEIVAENTNKITYVDLSKYLDEGKLLKNGGTFNNWDELKEILTKGFGKYSVSDLKYYPPEKDIRIYTSTLSITSSDDYMSIPPNTYIGLYYDIYKTFIFNFAYIEQNASVSVNMTLYSLQITDGNYTIVKTI